jgi:alkaline phosphatase D
VRESSDGSDNTQRQRGGGKLARPILRVILILVGVVAVLSAGFVTAGVGTGVLGRDALRPVEASKEGAPPAPSNASPEDPFDAEGEQVGPGVASVAPDTPWLKLDASSTLTRIGVGSCLGQTHPQPIWESVLGLHPRPQLFLMIGDNVYGDFKGADAHELVEAYRTQGTRAEFSKAREAMPFLATWDDHDYGLNDGGAEFPHKAIAAALFYDFWGLEPQRPFEQGIYHARVLGPEGKRVQIIMLDTRSQRSILQRKSERFLYWGRYEPLDDPERTMLGEAQWRWLDEQLHKDAEVRIIVTSVQFLGGGHGFERWGNLPLEQQRFLRLIGGANAKGVLLLSGDRHLGAFYKSHLDNGQSLPEMTTSSLNRPYGPSKDGPSVERVSKMYSQENFGVIDIDWHRRTIQLLLKGMAGETLDSLSVSFRELGIDE